jgi:hypothetical protein
LGTDRATFGRAPPPDVHDLLMDVLDAVAAEIETHVAGAGWDRPPALFALVPTAAIAADPQTAQLLDLSAGAHIAAESLTPVAQDDLPDRPLAEALASIEWPETVAGCALAQEIVVLPPAAEADLPGTDADLTVAATHPDRREARLVVAVTRDGATSCVLRLRGADGDEIAFGTDLAPNLAGALRATLR